LQGEEFAAGKPEFCPHGEQTVIVRNRQIPVRSASADRQRPD
jgi:hypothetical protein